MEKGEKTEIEQLEAINPEDIAINYEIDEAKVSSLSPRLSFSGEPVRSQS